MITNTSVSAAKNKEPSPFILDVSKKILFN